VTKTFRFPKRVENHPRVKTTRVLGVIFALEIKNREQRVITGHYLINSTQNFLLPMGNSTDSGKYCLYLLLTLSLMNNCKKIYDVVEDALEKV
jgi:adenosylmethionine-8-amino-7-oxononanoate aminotransferase